VENTGKMRKIGNLDSLDAIGRKMRKAELSMMSIQDLRKSLKDLRLDTSGKIPELVERLLDAEVRVEDVPEDEVLANQEEVDLSQQVDTKIEPSINDDFEKAHEAQELKDKIVAQMTVVPKEEIPAAEKTPEKFLPQKTEVRETPDQVRERINARTLADETRRQQQRELEDKIVKEISLNNNWPSKPETQAFIADRENMRRIKARLEGIERKAAAGSGRQPTKDNPFPSPRLEKKKLEVALPPVQKVEKPKPTPTPVPEKPMVKKSVGDLMQERKNVSEGKEIDERNKRIADLLVAGQELSPEDEAYRKAHTTEITRHFLKTIGAPGKPNVHESELEGPEQVVHRDRQPIETKVPVSEKPILETQEIKTPVVLDGNVEFTLGKLGILDVSNPREIEAKKAGVVEKFNKEVPNFLTLSPNQQMYVLDKLKQKASHDLDRNVALELNQARGLKKLFAGFREGAIRNNLIREARAGGLDSYKENLAAITDLVKTRDIDVEMTGKGRVLKFFSGKPQNETERKLIEEFNYAATLLAETPYDATLDDRTAFQILQKKKYEKIKASFDKVREKMMHYNLTEEKAALLLNIDDDIRMSQALSYNEEAASWIGQKLKRFGVPEKGITAAGGFAVRGLAKYAAGFGGGLGASAFLGGVTGRIRKSQEFQGINKDKRYSDAVQPQKGDTGPVLEKRAGVKEFIDAKGYADRISKLVKDIDRASGEKRDVLIQTLQNRILVARERDEAGLVRFGNIKDELKNKISFIQSMKEANKILLNNDPRVLELSEKVAERLNNMYFKDGQKDKARKEEMKKAFWRGFRNGALFFVGGFEANDWLFHNGEATKAAIEKMKSLSDDMVFTEIRSANPEVVRINPTSLSSHEGANTGYAFPDTHESVVSATDQTFTANAGHRGVIGMFDDLQKQLRTAYVGKDMPPQLKFLTGKNPEDLAKMFGAYKPGEGAGLDSLLVNKGATLSLEHDQLVFHDGLGHTQMISAEHGFEGTFASSQEAGASSIKEVAPRAPEIVPQHQEILEMQRPPLPHHEILQMRYDHPILEQHTVLPAENVTTPVEHTDSLSSATEHINPKDISVSRDLQIIHINKAVIDPSSKIFESATKQFGKARIDGDVAIFEKGYVGFYEESMKQNIALEKTALAANTNIHLVKGGMPKAAWEGGGAKRNLVKQISTQMKDGTYRVLSIYKKTP
jgi:hypothetical protein